MDIEVGSFDRREGVAPGSELDVAKLAALLRDEIALVVDDDGQLAALLHPDLPKLH